MSRSYRSGWTGPPVRSSLQIKQAGGMQRGKTDKVDAQRIAQYARTGGPVPLP